MILELIIVVAGFIGIEYLNIKERRQLLDRIQSSNLGEFKALEKRPKTKKVTVKQNDLTEI